MKTIITALANPELNKELKKIDEFKIEIPDIQYQEGIFETLEEKKVDFLIVSELLKGDDELEEFLKKIKEKGPNIKIILLLEKENKEKIKIAKNAKVEKILFHHKTTINEVIQYLKEIPTETNIEEEIRNIKKLIIENKTPQKNKILEHIKNTIKVNCKKEIKQNNEIIAITGGHGTGKSFITACLAMELKKEKTKILILDFDLLNENMHTIFGKKKFQTKKNEEIKQDDKFKIEDIQKYKIKINSHIDLISGSSLIFSEEKINIIQLAQIIEKLKKEYDIILVDTSSECYLEFNKFLLQISNTILVLTEGNLLEIKKTVYLLNIYKEKWNIEKGKIKIIFNKYHKNTIDEKILNTIFIEYEIIGKVKWNKNYALLINQNMKPYFLLPKEKKQYQKIIQNIFIDHEFKKIKKIIWRKLLWRN